MRLQEEHFHICKPVLLQRSSDPMFLSRALHCFLVPQGLVNQERSALNWINLTQCPYKEMRGLSIPLAHFQGALGAYTRDFKLRHVALLHYHRCISKRVQAGCSMEGKGTGVGWGAPISSPGTTFLHFSMR